MGDQLDIDALERALAAATLAGLPNPPRTQPADFDGFNSEEAQWLPVVRPYISAVVNAGPALFAAARELEALRRDLRAKTRELEAVMHFVDKWFDDGDPRLEQDPVNRANDARELTLQEIERLARSRNEAIEKGAVLAKLVDQTKARAVAFESERDKLRNEVHRLCAELATKDGAQ